MGDRIRIAVVDDHPLFRDGVASILRAKSDMEIIGEGNTAQDALKLARDMLPDIMLLDIAMPGGGLNAAKDIAIRCPVVKVVMLTVSEDEDDVLEAFKAGAKAYTLKGVSGSELIGIIKAVYAGQVYVTPELAANVLLDMTRVSDMPTSARRLVNDLTTREHEVLELVAAGNSNKEIGTRLYLSETTVKHYVSNILQKLQVRNRVEAALLALKSGVG